MAIGDPLKPVSPTSPPNPAPAPSPLPDPNQAGSLAGGYISSNAGAIDAQTKAMLDQLNSGVGFANQALGLNQGYITNQYGLQSQNLGNTLASQLFNNMLQQWQLELNRQGITQEKGTAYRNFDYQKQQIQNNAAARGAYGMPGWGQQGYQLWQGLLDTLGDLTRRWQGLDIQSAGQQRSAEDIRKQDAFQQAMLALSKNYQLQSGQLGFNQQLANAGFQSAADIAAANQQKQNLFYQGLGLGG